MTAIHETRDDAYNAAFIAAYAGSRRSRSNLHRAVQAAEAAYSYALAAADAAEEVDYLAACEAAEAAARAHERM